MFIGLPTFMTYGQKEASMWWMYNEILVNVYDSPVSFTAAPPITSSLGSPSNATICNNQGKLLFYTNGYNIYDQNNQIITNGTGLKGASIGLNDIVIIPKGVNEKEYYVVTTDSKMGVTTNYANDTSAYYSIVSIDKTGQKHVKDKNILLQKPSNDVLAATFHSNNIDTWLLLCGYNTSKLYTYLFTECGIVGPVISDVHLPVNRDYSGGTTFNFSPDGTKLIAWFDRFYVCNFDNSTGIVSSPIDFPDCYPYDTCFNNAESPYITFSPNSQYVYRMGSANGLHLYQKDLINIGTDSNILLTNPSRPGRMTILMNGKIYSDDGYNVCAYQYPDSPIQKKYYEVLNPLPAYVSNNNQHAAPYLTNFISSYMDPAYADVAKEKGIPNIIPSRVCLGDSTTFNVLRTLAVNEYWWSFGDGGSAYNIKNPKHFYANSGIYTATLIVRYNCSYDTINATVYVDSPVLSFSDETIISCKNLTLKAPSNFESYIWNTGDTNQQIVVNPPGIYTVSLMNGCGKFSQKFIINKPQTALYNVITPNGDGNNDYLFFTRSNIPLSLYIYNRWGTEVYHNSDYNNDWSGNNLEAGIFYYNVKYDGCEVEQSWLEIIH